MSTMDDGDRSSLHAIRNNNVVCYNTLHNTTLPPKDNSSIRIVLISDTHNQHDELDLPEGDILIHGGDFTIKGTMDEITNFTKWLEKQPFQHKIVVPGNHDILLDEEQYEVLSSHWHEVKESSKDAIEMLKNVCSLGFHEIMEFEVRGYVLRVFISPFQPRQPKSRHPMAFGKVRGKELKEKWKTLYDSKNIDIVLTHTPLHGVMDISFGNKHIGDEELLKAVKKVKPSIHIFGHVHECRGIEKLNRNTICINASSKKGHGDNNTLLLNPFVIDFKPTNKRE